MDPGKFNKSIQTTETPYYACVIWDLPEVGRQTINSSIGNFVQCSKSGAFMTDNVTRQIVIVLTPVFLIALFFIGLLPRAVIHNVFKEQSKKGEFDMLLSRLLVLNLTGDLGCMTAAVLAIGIFEYLERASYLQAFASVATCVAYLGRSGSLLMAAVMTIQRCRSVSCSIKMQKRKRKPVDKWLRKLPFYFAISFGLLRLYSYFLMFDNLDDVQIRWIFEAVDGVDIFLPPLILIFSHIVLFFKLRKLKKERMGTTSNIMRPKILPFATGLCPIILVVFCNLGHVAFFTCGMVDNGHAYRELFLWLILSNMINSTLNVPIYGIRRDKLGDLLKQMQNLYLCNIGGGLEIDDPGIIVDNFTFYDGEVLDNEAAAGSGTSPT